MPVERAPRLRLFDILDSLNQIRVSIAGASADELRRDIVRYRAIERWLEIISEASRHVGDDLKASAPEIPWKQVADFGNVTRHGYETVDPRLVWNIVTYDLPSMKVAVERLYALVKQPADPWPDADPK